MMKFLEFLLVIGMAISLFLIYEHFSNSENEICVIGDSFNCDVVNKSPYSTLNGIFDFLNLDFGLSFKSNFVELIFTNAFLGFLTLLILFFFLQIYYRRIKFFKLNKKKALLLIKGITLLSVIYGGFLFYIQHSILRSYCIFCIFLDIILVVLFILSWKLK